MMYLNDTKSVKQIMSSPNNILGIEYLKALKHYKSSIQAHTIGRFEADYNSKNLVEILQVAQQLEI